MSLETFPKDLRHPRACLLCSLVKTIDQFEYDGCDNCESYLQMKGNREMVYECTSSSFDGCVITFLRNHSMIIIYSPYPSHKVDVVFCLSGVVRELKSRGVIYRSRDTAVKT
ncbi:transcription elongation factor SPT4-like [Carassius carassius]|uniref:transcription elongation factor SPT4-like n=1 Tax=Carassius carassius TaxID=217509 RepID=UPI002868B105|nr:transcription elongation factor SPT4-like [Carassius carassius]